MLSIEKQPFGRLTVTEDRGKVCVCECSCGATGIIRLRKSLSNPFREPMCKACDREKSRRPKMRHVTFVSEEEFQATLRLEGIE